MTSTHLPDNAIPLEFKHLLCKRHGEPLRENWPAGFTLCAIRLFQLACEEGSIWDELWLYLNKRQEDIDISQPGRDRKAFLQQLEKKPCCCRIKPDVMYEFYKELFQFEEDVRKGTPELRNPFEMAICDNCGKAAPGAGFRIDTGRGIRTYPHVCFECVVYRMTDQQGRKI